MTSPISGFTARASIAMKSPYNFLRPRKNDYCGRVVAVRET
ncbi:hypothetical protein ACFFX0_18350 [Citricoccus parietis]|uniref:Uncharacterized protein n=1 Tax=Citricoccus parietis TaxID=592307 RepID=A0ABV5G295_9MICC